MPQHARKGSDVRGRRRAHPALAVGPAGGARFLTGCHRSDVAAEFSRAAPWGRPLTWPAKRVVSSPPPELLMEVHCPTGSGRQHEGNSYWTQTSSPPPVSNKRMSHGNRVVMTATSTHLMIRNRAPDSEPASLGPTYQPRRSKDGRILMRVVPGAGSMWGDGKWRGGCGLQGNTRGHIQWGTTRRGTPQTPKH
jgi:hypothetical protein